MLELAVIEVSSGVWVMREVGVSEIVEVIEDVVDDTGRSVDW